MEAIHSNCAGLDVHKASVVACSRVMTGRKVSRATKTFGTTTVELLELVEWLSARGCTHVVMEATGVYWKPVWHVLEGGFDLVLANARDVKNVPGRKTDVKDAEWLADLLAHGLIRGSFVPPQPIAQLRDLTRMRKQLSREVVQHTNRIQKVLQQANVKLSSMVTDILGKSGRAMIEAIIEGEADAKRLARLGSSRLKASEQQLEAALRGRVTEHHRFMLKLHLQQVDALRQSMEAIEARIDDQLKPYQQQVENLQTIPGVGLVLAATLIAELGVNMDQFPTAKHAVSWVGLCPRNDESAGKRRSNRVRQGNGWLKPALVQAAWAAARSKDTYLRAQYYRLRARRGPKKAVVAVAASMLASAYAILRDGVPYQELGPDHFTTQNKTRAVARHLRRLQQLGCAVSVVGNNVAVAATG